MKGYKVQITLQWHLKELRVIHETFYIDSFALRCAENSPIINCLHLQSLFNVALRNT